MTIEEIREKILTDDEFILEEVKKLQYACSLKNIIRYDLTRNPEDYTESVAEHTHSMQVLADYFSKLELAGAELDYRKTKIMITWHDMDEIETGDKISWKKTPEDIADELTAWKATAEKLPAVLKSEISVLINDYEHLESPEAKFVKAVDKIEPLFHLYNEKGKKWIRAVGLNFEKSEKIKVEFIRPFPVMKRFMDVIHKQMLAEDFFCK